MIRGIWRVLRDGRYVESVVRWEVCESALRV